MPASRDSESGSAWTGKLRCLHLGFTPRSSIELRSSVLVSRSWNSLALSHVFPRIRALTLQVQRRKQPGGVEWCRLALVGPTHPARHTPFQSGLSGVEHRILAKPGLCPDTRMPSRIEDPSGSPRGLAACVPQHPQSCRSSPAVGLSLNPHVYGAPNKSHRSDTGTDRQRRVKYPADTTKASPAPTVPIRATVPPARPVKAAADARPVAEVTRQHSIVERAR